MNKNFSRFPDTLDTLGLLISVFSVDASTAMCTAMCTGKEIEDLMRGNERS